MDRGYDLVSVVTRTAGHESRDGVDARRARRLRVPECRWRWTNVPVPEPHVVGLVVGAVLQARIPWRLTRGRWCSVAVGWSLVGLGVAVVTAAVAAAGSTDVERPAALLTAGPYAFSRNPMYAGWTAVYAGVTPVANAAWLAALFPFVVVTTRVVVRREEQALERAFGGEYRAYRRDVRRYL